MVFSIFTMPCNHHFSSKALPSSSKETAHTKQLLHMPPPQMPATVNLLSVSKDSPTLDISYKWDHKVCNCLWLAAFISIIFWGSSMLSRKSLVPFHGWIIFHHGNKWNLLIHSSVYGYRQFASFSYYEHCCSEHVCTCLSMEGFWVVKWHFLICIIVGALWLLCWKETERNQGTWLGLGQILGRGPEARPVVAEGKCGRRLGVIWKSADGFH